MSEVEAVAKTSEDKEVSEKVSKEEVTKDETTKEVEAKEEVSKEDVERAFQLIAQGKRNLLCQEIPDAVNQFQEATKILAGKYGETAKECGDAYFCYGKSLLEMSRMETGVLGNALEGIEDEEEEDSDKKSESSEEKVEDGEKVTDDDTATEAESEELNTEEEGETEDKEGEEKKEEEEEVSNLQLAWEVLELAKKIFKDDDSKEAKLKLADTHLKLGEVALETEQYESAVGDFKECLDVQKTVLAEDDRLLAETHYQLGVAYNLAFQYNESLDNFKNAQTVMEARIKSLEKVIEEGEKVGKGKDIADFEDPVYKAHKEIKELKEILPDVVTKIEDVQEEQKTADIAKAELKATVGFEKAPEAEKPAEASGAGEGSSSTEPTNVITHLVRKKRKTESDEEKDDTKKAKLENGSGDAPPANGVNGAKTSPEKKPETAMETEEVKTKSVEDVKAAAEASS